MAKILILGGGFGGVPTARKLRELLPEEHEIVVIDKRDYFMVGFRKTWGLLGEAPLSEGQRKLTELEKFGIRYMQAEIEAIHPEETAVTVGGQRLQADALVVALGAALAPENVPGFQEHAINAYDPDGVEHDAARIRAFKGGRALVGVFGKPYKCPPAPYELAILLKEKLDSWGIQSDVEVFTPLPATLPVLGEAGCASLDGYLFNKRIAFHPNRMAASIEPGEVRFEDGTSMPFDLLLGVPPHRPPEVVRRSGLTGGAPWVKVDRRTLETDFPNVYAIGDVTAVLMDNGKPLPKAGVFAQGEGLVVAERIAARIMGRPPQAEFEGHGGCFLEVGDGRAVMVQGHFLAEGRPLVSLTEASLGYVQ
jgi:sulfide:quinone oxidoreductase